MRNRYVLQVLLATFGFAMVLAVIAVLETPADWSPRASDPPRAPAELRLCGTSEPSAHATKTTPRTNDSKDECVLPTQSGPPCARE